MKIANRLIGLLHPPYIIAEMSANHNGSIEHAFQIIKAAAHAGADAVKLQTYTPDTITLDSSAEEFLISGGRWDGRRLYDLYAEAMLPWEWHKPLFDHARNCGITIFSTPFDKTAVNLLEELDAPAYKIASFEAVDLPLIRYVASKGKPMIISTGMADCDEIYEAIAAARAGGCGELALLHCVSGYPAPASDYNLATVVDMAKRFAVPVGLSDHTIDNTTAIASIALGATIIEKHITLDRTGGGPDDGFSLEPDEFAALCGGARTAWEAMGTVNYGLKSSEETNLKFRRSLYFVEDIKAGEVIAENSVRSVRPGYGLAPKFLDAILGKRVKYDIEKNSPVMPTDLE